MSNRVHKINSHQGVTWRHVLTADNPTDLGSRGGQVKGADLWWHGPEWLATPERWPAEILNEQSDTSQAEAKLVRDVLAVAVNEENEIKDVLQKFSLQKAVRVCAWIRRFVHNSLRSRGTQHISGPLTTDETDRQRRFWAKQVQDSCDIGEDRVALNLQPNQEGLLECRGQVQGEYLLYLSDIHPFSLHVVEEVHRQTLHGGVGLTMAKVHNRYW